MAPKNTAYARMIREQKPQHGAAHVVMEDFADGMFRGPAKADHNIDLVVLTAAAQRLSQEKVLAELPDAAVPHLISRLGADDPATGILVLDGVMADALIEQQTLGRVSAAPRVERPVTAIDAALSSGFATSVISKLASLTEDKPFAKDLAGYSCGRPQIDRAALSLALSSKQYDVLRVELDLGPGLKRGIVQLVVPASASPEVSQPKVPKVNPDMIAVVQEAELRLSVSLPRIKMSLKTLISLAPDSVVPLETEMLSQVRIVDTVGRKFATAKLGQFKGHRAVRVQLPAAAPAPMAEVAQDLALVGAPPSGAPAQTPHSPMETTPQDAPAMSGGHSDEDLAMLGLGPDMEALQPNVATG